MFTLFYCEMLDTDSFICYYVYREKARTLLGGI